MEYIWKLEVTSYLKHSTIFPSHFASTAPFDPVSPSWPALTSGHGSPLSCWCWLVDRFQYFSAPANIPTLQSSNLLRCLAQKIFSFRKNTSLITVSAAVICGWHFHIAIMAGLGMICNFQTNDWWTMTHNGEGERKKPKKSKLTIKKGSRSQRSQRKPFYPPIS